MLRLVLSFSCLSLALAGAAMADPMPDLPPLPPLPTDYVSQGESGAFAGILSGYVDGTDAGLGVAIVVGNTFEAADLILGVEGMASVASHGEISLEGSIRAGIGLTETVDVFGHVGVGYSLDTDAFLSVGTSLEADVGSGWLFRADYRYNHDLSGDAGARKVLAGLLHRF